MLKTFGFSKVEALASPVSPDNPLRHKTRLPLLTRVDNNATHRTIVHAWRWASRDAVISSLGDALLAAFHDRSNRSLFRPEETEFV
jgi:hypothetical protein